VAILVERFGNDLRLLENLQLQYDRARGRDLVTHKRPGTNAVDLQTLRGIDNLAQALLLRFLTPVGELAQLGHPDYGSRLSELIGELNNETNRNRARMFVLQALTAEPRVREIRRLRVVQGAGRDQIDVSVSLLPVDSDTPLNFVFPFFLQGGSQP
jgi:phage baseplate assembly protein W